MFVLSLVGLSLRVPEDSEPFIKPTRRKGGGRGGSTGRKLEGLWLQAAAPTLQSQPRF